MCLTKASLESHLKVVSDRSVKFWRCLCAGLIPLSILFYMKLAFWIHFASQFFTSMQEIEEPD